MATIIFSIIFSIFILFIFRKYSKANGGKPRQKLPSPPGPPTLPLIGHIHLMLKEVVPFRAFNTLAKTYGEIMQLKLGDVPVVVISSSKMAKEALKIQDPMFADRPQSVASQIMWYNYKDIAFSPYNEYWRQMRKICIVEMLSAKNVRSFGSIRSDEISIMEKELRSSSGSEIDLTDLIFKLMSSITCRAAYGKVCKDRDGLIKLMNETVVFAGGFLLADLFPSSKILNLLSWNKYTMLRLRRKLDVILDDIIQEHKLNLKGQDLKDGDVRRTSGNGESGNEDLVDVLLRLQETGELQFPE